VNFKEFTKLFCDFKKDGTRRKSSENKLRSWEEAMELTEIWLMVSSKDSEEALKKLNGRKDLSEFEKAIIFCALQHAMTQKRRR